MFSKFLNTNEGSIIISIIWGLGISCLFKKVCNNKNCIIYKAPKENSILNNIFKYKDKCFNFKKIKAKCSNNVINE